MEDRDRRNVKAGAMKLNRETVLLAIAAVCLVAFVWLSFFYLSEVSNRTANFIYSGEFAKDLNPGIQIHDFIQTPTSLPAR